MMAAKPSRRARLRTVVRVWVDALTYAVALAVVSTVVAVTLGITTGGEFVRGKRILFVVGWTMMAYATAKLWVKSGKQVRASAKRRQSEPPGRHEPDDDQPDEEPAAAFPDRAGRELARRNSYGESLRARQDTTRFQALVQSLPPNRWVLPPRPEARIGITGKILLASVLVLGLSLAMETLFGVA